MISNADARRAALLAANLYGEGSTPSFIKRILEAEYPQTNGFDRNRIVDRGVRIWEIKVTTEFGSPPANIILPYPTVPSSTPVPAPPNRITIDSRVRIEFASGPDQYRIARAEGFSGDTYASMVAKRDDVIGGWATEYAIVDSEVITEILTLF